MPRNIANKVVLLAFLFPKHLPKHCWLHKVLFSDWELLGYCRTCPLLVLLARLHRFVCHVTVGRRVIGISTVISVDCHYSITLIGVKGTERLVDGNLLVIDAKAMAVGVWI